MWGSYGRESEVYLSALNVIVSTLIASADEHHLQLICIHECVAHLLVSEHHSHTGLDSIREIRQDQIGLDRLEEHWVIIVIIHSRAE